MLKRQRHPFIAVLTVATAAWLGFSAGCQPPNTEQSGQPDTEQTEQDREVSPDEVQQDIAEAADTLKTYSRQQRAEAVRQAKDSFQKIHAELKKLQQRVGKMKQGTREQFQQSIDDLQEQLAKAEQQTDQLETAGEEAWSRVEGDLRDAVTELEQAYSEAATAIDRVDASEDDGTTEEPGTDKAPEASINGPSASGSPSADGGEQSSNTDSPNQRDEEEGTIAPAVTEDVQPQG